MLVKEQFTRGAWSAVLVALASLFVLFGTASAQGGVIRVALQAMPESFNPVLPIELNGSTVAATLFAPLAVVNPETFVTEPYLAERWEVSDDLTTWTFYLHQNAVWHDGVPVTAEDVKFTYDRMKSEDEGLLTRASAATMETIEIVDEHTVRIHLAAPNAVLPDMLAGAGFEPLPKHIFEGYQRLADAVDANTRQPVGSGAFRIGRIVPGSEIEVVAFEDFFLGRPQVDRIVFRVVRDRNAAVAQILSGDLDWAEIEAIHRDIIAADPRKEVFSALGTRYVMMAINVSDYEPWHTLLGDVRVRQAMMYAVDRQSIAEHIGLGLAPVLETVIPSTLTWIPEPDIEPYTYDPERAKALLDEAGWVDADGDGIREKDGVKLSFYTLVDLGSAVREQIGLVLQSSWQAIGMEVDYIATERTGRWIEETRDGTFPTRISTFPIPNADWVSRLFHSAGASNRGIYSNAEVDALLEAVLSTADLEEQGRLLKRVQELMHEDAYVMPFFIEPAVYALDGRLRNVPRGELRLALPYAYAIYFE